MLYTSEVLSGPAFLFSMLPWKAVFSESVAMGLMYLNSDPVLLAVYKDTNFSTIKFVSSVSSANIWKTLVIVWMYIYTGFSSHIYIYKDLAFTSIEWVQLWGKMLQWKRLHLVRNHIIYWVKDKSTIPCFTEYFTRYKIAHFCFLVRCTYQLLSRRWLKLQVQTSWFLFYFFFGKYPRILHASQPPMTPSKRYQAMFLARKEFETSYLEGWIRIALLHKLPTDLNFCFAPNNSVYI